MLLTKFLSDENVVDIEGMDGEGIFCFTVIDPLRTNKVR